MEKLTEKKFIEMLMTGTAFLEAHKDEVNRINVFPVADNDTGENMHLTMKLGLAALKGAAGELGLGPRAEAVARTMVYGAQGNSGIILAGIFQGFAESLGEGSLADLKAAFESAARAAYGAVPNPVEGTMLTAIRDGAKAVAAFEGSIEDYFVQLAAALETELARTKETLKILSDNHVVDSGALGLLYIFRGFAESFENPQEIDLETISIAPHAQVHPDKPGLYCTNFLVKLNESASEAELRSLLVEKGSSIVLFKSGDCMKGHVHTDAPEEILSQIAKFGEIISSGLDLMENERTYTLFADTNCDLTPAVAEKNNIKLIYYPYTVDGKTIYPYIDFDEFDYKDFYGKMRRGEVNLTSFALTKEQYAEYFEPEFQRGKDVLYVHQSSATTGTFKFMYQAVEELLKKYPGRRFEAIDTLAFTGLGYLLCLEAADLYNAGATIDEILKWSETGIQSFAMYNAPKDLSFFAKSGRISRLEAGLGNFIGMHPILHASREGIMEVYDKSFGMKATLRRIIRLAEEDSKEIGQHRIIVAHSDTDKNADFLEAEFRRKYPDAEICRIVVNPVIGLHSGPDNVGFSVYAPRRESKK